MSEHWLSSEEVRLITGRIRASAQRRVLTERRIQFILDADGRPDSSNFCLPYLAIIVTTGVLCWDEAEEAAMAVSSIVVT